MKIDDKDPDPDPSQDMAGHPQLKPPYISQRLLKVTMKGQR